MEGAFKEEKLCLEERNVGTKENRAWWPFSAVQWKTRENHKLRVKYPMKNKCYAADDHKLIDNVRHCFRIFPLPRRRFVSHILLTQWTEDAGWSLRYHVYKWEQRYPSTSRWSVVNVWLQHLIGVSRWICSNWIQKCRFGCWIDVVFAQGGRKPSETIKSACW